MSCPYSTRKFKQASLQMSSNQGIKLLLTPGRKLGRYVVGTRLCNSRDLALGHIGGNDSTRQWQ